MATEWISPTWRMPEESNQSKFENYSLDFASSTVTTTATMTNLGISTAFSVSFWFKADTLAIYSSLVIGPVSAGDWSAGFGFIAPSTNKLRFFLAGWNSAGRYVDSGTLALDTWYHVVGTFNTTDGLKLYINAGTPTTVSSSTITGLTQVISIGSSLGSYNYDGLISQVSIFNYTLSTDQISYLYNSGTPQNPMAISG